MEPNEVTCLTSIRDTRTKDQDRETTLQILANWRQTIGRPKGGNVDWKSVVEEDLEAVRKYSQSPNQRLEIWTLLQRVPRQYAIALGFYIAHYG